jgi:hypothetical protein
VSARRKRWQAHIYYDSKNHSLGCFDTKQEAALAYDRKARQRGKDALLNYESIKAAEEAAAAAAQVQAEQAIAQPEKPGPGPSPRGPRRTEQDKSAMQLMQMLRGYSLSMFLLFFRVLGSAESPYLGLSLCGGFISAPKWEATSGSRLTSINSVHAQVMVHTCHIMADTVFFTTIIDQNSQQLSGIAHSVFVKDGVFEVTAMIPGVVGHSLLKAAMKWQISWVGAHGAGTGRSEKDDWDFQERGTTSLSGLFSKTVDTSVANFSSMPKYFVSLESSGQGGVRILGGNSVIQAARTAAFSVVMKVGICEQDGICETLGRSHTPVGKRGFGVTVAYMGVTENSNAANYKVGSASGPWGHKRGATNIHMSVKTAPINDDAHFITAISIPRGPVLRGNHIIDGNVDVRDVSPSGFSVYLASPEKTMKWVSNAASVNWLVFYANGRAPSAVTQTPYGTPPLISLKGEPETNERVRESASYVDAGASCSDSTDGLITANLKVNARQVRLSKPGRYHVYFTCVNDEDVEAVPLTRLVIVHSLATYKMHMELLHMKEEDRQRDAADQKLLFAVCMDAVREQCSSCNAHCILSQKKESLRVSGCTENMLQTSSEACKSAPTPLPTSAPTSAPTNLPTIWPTARQTSNPTDIPTTTGTSEILMCDLMMSHVCGALVGNDCLECARVSQTLVQKAGCTKTEVQTFCAKTDAPSFSPSMRPSSVPSIQPTMNPTAWPTTPPTHSFTSPPSVAPTSKIQVLEEELVCTSALAHACKHAIDAKECNACAKAFKTALLLTAQGCTSAIITQWCSLNLAETLSPSNAPTFEPTTMPTKRKFNPVVEAENKATDRLDSFVQELVDTVRNKTKNGAFRPWKRHSPNGTSTAQLHRLAQELGQEIREKTPAPSPPIIVPSLRPTSPPSNTPSQVPTLLSPMVYSSAEGRLVAPAVKQTQGRRTGKVLNVTTLLGLALLCCLFTLAFLAQDGFLLPTNTMLPRHDEETKQLISEVRSEPDSPEAISAFASVGSLEHMPETATQSAEPDDTKLKWGRQLQGLRAELTGSEQEDMDTTDEILSGLILEIMEDIFTSSETWISLTEIYAGEALLVRLKKTIKKAASSGLVLKGSVTKRNEASVKQALSCSFTALQRTLRGNKVYEGGDVLNKLRAALMEGAEQVIEVVGPEFLAEADQTEVSSGGETALRI